jgi:hypothetical protein
MSEKIYGWLLRLFPSRFRAAYGEDALQLFRDRARHETGFLLRVRLWFDLLGDLASSLPREYRYAQPGAALTVSPQRINAAPFPSLFILRDTPPRATALLSGFVLTVSSVLLCSSLLNQAAARRPSRSSFRTPQASASPRASTPSSAQAAENANISAAAPGSDETLASQQSAAAPPSFAPNDASSNAAESPASTSFTDSRSNRSFAQPPALPPADSHSPIPPSNSPSAAAPSLPNNLSRATALASTSLDAAERHRVIGSAAAALREHYVYRGDAQRMAESLLAHEKRGDDDAATDGGTFAALLTRQMREVRADRHLSLDYFPDPLPPQPTAITSEPDPRYREIMKQQNCTFEKVEILAHNIGYLKLNSFPDPAVCEATAKAAMATLNGADALIYDLRDNRGGTPDMVAFMAAYLFDHPEYWYNPRENTTDRSWTHSPVPGSKLADKPVFVLTSHQTISGAEHFSYDLKMLRRATIVGETTGGAAHSGIFYRLDDHFGMGIPEANPINPYSTPDWAETGVDPDIKVPAADALSTALKLAEAKLAKK